MLSYDECLFLTDGFVLEDSITYGNVVGIYYIGKKAVYGIHIGMSLEQVEEILGKPNSTYLSYYSELYMDDNLMANYKAGEYVAIFEIDDENETASTSATDSIIKESDGTASPQKAVLYWRFKKTSETTDQTSAAVVKVSADLTGPGSITSSITKTISETFSISLSGEQKTLVRASATASIDSSVSTTLGYSHIFEEDEA